MVGSNWSGVLFHLLVYGIDVSMIHSIGFGGAKECNFKRPLWWLKIIKKK